MEIVTLMMLKKGHLSQKKTAKRHNEKTLLWRKEGGDALDNCFGNASGQGFQQ